VLRPSAGTRSSRCRGGCSRSAGPAGQPCPGGLDCSSTSCVRCGYVHVGRAATMQDHSGCGDGEWQHQRESAQRAGGRELEGGSWREGAAAAAVASQRAGGSWREGAGGRDGGSSSSSSSSSIGDGSSVDITFHLQVLPCCAGLLQPLLDYLLAYRATAGHSSQDGHHHHHTDHALQHSTWCMACLCTAVLLVHRPHSCEVLTPGRVCGLRAVLHR
jgi:hypothetical protein